MNKLYTIYTWSTSSYIARVSKPQTPSKISQKRCNINPIKQMGEEFPMNITTRGRYALRASLALAKLGTDGEPVSINNLSEEENISSVFLEQIFYKLRKAGIVTSIRGPGGGFCFAKSLNELTVKQVLEAAGENLEITFCDKTDDNCDKTGQCLCHYIWLEVNQLVKNYFNNISISSILEKHKNVVVNSEAEKHE
jgi:Rrf2 family transcriptional regulator, iron-sulfur cluster assembly transcription factor